ncbi:MAG: hypothetical protein ACO2PN_28130 [Pyrobaculum sp.]
MDRFKKCVEATKNPQLCAFLHQTNQMISNLAECVMEKVANECLRECLKRCRGEKCEEVCLGALETAAGIAMARTLAERATLATSLLNIDLVDAAVLVFNKELKSAEEMDCPDKAAAARILSIATMELFAHIQTAAGSSPEMQKRVQSLLLLVAPALAEAYQCVGEEVFEYLETIRLLIGEEMTKRIAAALEEGAALVGSVVVKFRPVKTGS